MNDQFLHATAISLNGNGVLLVGPSGSGKSDLALRLIDRGAILVGDDAIGTVTFNGYPMLVCAPNIEGRIEVRGIGICNMESVQSVPLRLVAELTSDVERMPSPDGVIDMNGYDVPFLKIAPFEISAAIKLEIALRAIVDEKRFPVASNGSGEAESIDI